MVWFSATRSDRRRGVPSCLMVSRTTIFDGRLLVRRRTIVRNHGNPRVRATRALAATAAAARQENCVGRTGTTIDRSRWRFVGQLLSGSCRVNTPPALSPALTPPPLRWGTAQRSTRVSLVRGRTEACVWAPPAGGGQERMFSRQVGEAVLGSPPGRLPSRRTTPVDHQPVSTSPPRETRPTPSRGAWCLLQYLVGCGVPIGVVMCRCESLCASFVCRRPLKDLTQKVNS
jgi:hypothetical protein